MNGGLQQFARVSADTPLADRWDELGEAIDDYAATMRAEHIERERERQEWFNRATHSDALREMQLVPTEAEKPKPSIVGTGGWLVIPMALALTAACVCIWAGASSPTAPTTAFVASPSSQQAVSTKGFNRFAGVAK